MIYIIGIATGGIKSLTAEAIKRIDGATLLVGARRHLDLFPVCEGERFTLGSIKAALVKIKNLDKGNTVILATGDPGLYGIGDYICRELGRKHVRIIANISVVQEAFARIKESWSRAAIISVHGRKGGEDRGIDRAVTEILSHKKSAVFTDPENTPGKISKTLIERGATGFIAYVFEALGTESEKITKGTLKKISRMKFDPMNLLILIAPDGVRGVETTPGFGLSASEFKCDNGLITKGEVRAVTLSKLALEAGSILWDIGAGSGSVSVEAAALLPYGRVYAIEQKKSRTAHIRANRAKFKRANLIVVVGKAPAILKDLLPDPDRVFIGGGGKGIKDILKVVGKRLKENGTVVVNAVTLETVSSATDFFKGSGWRFEMVTINLSRAKNIGGLNIMDAENPVTIITAKRA